MKTNISTKKTLDGRYYIQTKRSGEMLLISEEPTQQEITLSGKEGYNNGTEVLDMLCQELTGIEEARNLTEADIINSEYWEDKKKAELIFKAKEYWLSTRYAIPSSSSNCYFGLKYVYSDGVSRSDLYYSTGGIGYATYALRPLVSVKI